MATKKKSTPQIQIVEDRTVEVVKRDDDGKVVDRTQYQPGDEEALREELADRPEDFQHFLENGAIELASDDDNTEGGDAKGNGSKKEGSSK